MLYHRLSLIRNQTPHSGSSPRDLPRPQDGPRRHPEAHGDTLRTPATGEEVRRHYFIVRNYNHFAVGKLNRDERAGLFDPRQTGRNRQTHRGDAGHDSQEGAALLRDGQNHKQVRTA